MMNDSKSISEYLSSGFWESDAPELLTRLSERDAQHDLMSADLDLEGAILFQTSGSSGSPKWVVHTRKSILSSAQSVIDHLQITNRDSWYLALPVEHVGGFGIIARAYLVGNRVVPHIGKWDAVRAVGVLGEEEISLISLVPAQVADLVSSHLKCPNSIRAVIVGGGALDKSLKLEAIELGWPILCSYGMSETGSQIATQVVVGGGVDLIKPWEVKNDVDGFLQVKGDGLFSGYLSLLETGWGLVDPKQDGWFSTKDKVEITDRDLTFLRRGDRQVKILGELIDLDKLECKLCSAVDSEVVLIAKKDLRRGVILIPVMERNSFDQAKWGQLNLSGLERLEELCLCDGFPRTKMGKLDRMKLRDSIVFFDK